MEAVNNDVKYLIATATASHLIRMMLRSWGRVLPDEICRSRWDLDDLVDQEVRIGAGLQVLKERPVDILLQEVASHGR